VAHELSYHFIIPLKLKYHSIEVANVRVNAVVHGKCDRCRKQSELKASTPVCKMADNGRLAMDQKVKVVLFYAETKSVVATQRRFRAHFGTLTRRKIRRWFFSKSRTGGDVEVRLPS
jgi:transposase-like protein